MRFFQGIYLWYLATCFMSGLNIYLTTTRKFSELSAIVVFGSLIYIVMYIGLILAYRADSEYYQYEFHIGLIFLSPFIYPLYPIYLALAYGTVSY